MGCGCKKKKNIVEQPTEVSTTNEQVTKKENVNLTLTEEQQKTVNEIIAKLNQVNS